MSCHVHSAKQRIWDRPLLERVMDEMADSLPSVSDQARWRAVTAPHAGDWLQAMPIASCGLKLDDEAVKVVVGLRLGTNLCEPQTFVCGQQVTAQGHHGLSCIRGFGRQARHGVINDVIYRALTKAGYPTVKEPPELVRSDGKRPDGLTLIPLRAGRSLDWDATVADTLAASYIANTSTTSGAAAEACSRNQKTSQVPGTLQ